MRPSIKKRPALELQGTLCAGCFESPFVLSQSKESGLGGLCAACGSTSSPRTETAQCKNNRNTLPLFARRLRTAILGGVVWRALAAILLAALACGGTSAASTQEPLQVVTTTPLLADLVRNVAGAEVEVHSVVPPGADVHSFQTTPQESIRISQAVAIFSNGFGLDDFLMPVIDSAAKAGAVQVVVSDGLQTSVIKSAKLGQRSSGKLAKPLNGGPDPHFWQNPIYTVHYVQRIRDGLVKADGANAETYRSNAEKYIQELRELDQEISRILGEVPPHRRHLVTFHDAFGHFASRYGWQASGLLPNDAGGVTPGTIIAMMEQLREEDIGAVFAEPQFRSQVINRAGRDAGVRIGRIYSDVLDDNVSTYTEMMRFNARSLAEHLRD